MPMARGVPPEAEDLAAHSHKGKIFLDRALERVGEFGDAVFRQVEVMRDPNPQIFHAHMIAEHGSKRDAGAGGGLGRTRACARLGDFGVERIQWPRFLPPGHRFRRLIPLLQRKMQGNSRKGADKRPDFSLTSYWFY